MMKKGIYQTKEALMLPSEREQVILDYLAKHQTVSTARLCEVTGVSIATVRRDLNSLHRRGLLEKTHGGARYLPPPTAAVPPALPHQNDPAFADKDAIARTAAGFIYPGDIVFLGAGKTCTLIAHHIREKKNITIVTTNLNVVFELASSGNSMLLLGGDIHVGSNYVETLGEYTLEEMHGLYFDKVFFTVNGVDMVNGYSIVSRSQLPLYHYLLKNCKSPYVVVNSAKFHHRAFTQLCSLQEIPHVILNPQTPSVYLDYYQEHHITVHYSTEAKG